KPFHREPVEPVVAFHLAEDSLHFYGAFAPVVLSCFRSQQVPCPGLQFVQAVVDFDYPVAFGLMALSPHGAAFAAPGLIIAHTGNILVITRLPLPATAIFCPMGHT